MISKVHNPIVEPRDQVLYQPIGAGPMQCVMQGTESPDQIDLASSFSTKFLTPPQSPFHDQLEFPGEHTRYLLESFFLDLALVGTMAVSCMTPQNPFAVDFLL
jgi:hypothetical protein